MSKKRRREQPVVDVQLIEIYEDLAHLDEYVRLKAAHTLLTKFVHGGAATGSQLNEVIRRLFRGLCSGRKAARLGFSIALTELLTELLGPKAEGVPGLHSLPELLDVLEGQTRASGNVSGQEERDHQFGRLFGAESIIKSNILFHHDVAFQNWERVLGIIYELAKRKPWLREECGFVLFNAIRAVRDQDPKYAQAIIDGLQRNDLAKTPEGMAIWIAAKEGCLNLQFPDGIWQHDNPLDRKEKSSLAKILRDGAVVNDNAVSNEQNAAQQGTWSTKIHFVWDVIMAKLLYSDLGGTVKKSKGANLIMFADFWETCVDNALFATASSQERKYWGLLLFQRVIRDAPLSFVASLFTQNLMRCLINQLGSSDRFLHRAAEKTVKSIVTRAKIDPLTTSPIVRALLAGPYGDVNFDRITKTKTIEIMTSQLGRISFGELIPLYEELILKPGAQDEKSAASRRLITVDQLVSALRNSALELDGTDPDPNDSNVVCRVLHLLAKCSYFNIETVSDAQSIIPNPPISHSSQQIFRSRISSCLAHLIAKATNSAIFACQLVELIRDHECHPERGLPLFEADETVSKVIAKARTVLEKANKKAGKQQTSINGTYLRSVILLYSLTILQIYNEDTEAVIILEELNQCFGGMLHHKTSNGKGSAALVEILLSFVAKPSQLFRRLAQQVFTVCACDIDEMGLQSMNKILETRESLSGQVEMFDQDDDEDDDGESDSVSDVEKADVPQSGSVSANSQEADQDSEDGSSDRADESDGPDEELAAFDTKLAQALGTRPGHQDEGAQDSSPSDEDMDDEQMEALDEHLEKIFREKKKLTSKKTEKKDAKETIINFKCRVLELLEIYVKQQHANILALNLLIPILKTIRSTTSPLVSSKACNVMREYSKNCKGEGVPKFDDIEALFNLLEEIHLEAGKEGSNTHTSACSQASLLVVKVLVARDRELLRRVVRIYGKSQEDSLFDSSYKVKTGFFTEWLNWCTSIKK